MKKGLIKIFLIVGLSFCATCCLALVCACSYKSTTQSEGKINHAHVFGELETILEPTCIEDGICERYCSCGDVIYDSVPALGHDYIGHDGKVPDCVHDGWYDYKTCSRCDYSDFVVIHALGHDFGEWHVTSEATCLSLGEESRECLRCRSFTQTRSVDKCGHTSGEWIIGEYPTCETDGYKFIECKVCCEEIERASIPALGHSFGEWVETTAPTCTTVGIETRYCAHDSTHTEARNSGLSPHNYQWIYDSESHSSVCSACGNVAESGLHEWSGEACAVCGYEKPINSGLDFVLIGGTSYSVSGIGSENSGDIVIPAEFKGLPVTEIREGAFRLCDILRTVTVSDGVIKIGKEAFYGCANLTSVIMSDTVEIIGDGAFKLCENLTNLTLSENLTEIGTEAFASCSKLQTFTVSECVKFIGAGAFKESGINSIEFAVTQGWNLYFNGKSYGTVPDLKLSDPVLAYNYMLACSKYDWMRE